MYSLLIVDDEPKIVDGISHILDWAEYGVKICKSFTSSLDALEFIRINHVDILITDIRMPGMDGIELIREAKEAQPNIHIIVLSGYNDFEYVRTAALMGIENYLLKPVNLNELEKTLLNTVKRIEHKNLLLMQQHENMRILRENILNLWVNGNIEPFLIKEKLQLININAVSKAYRVVIFKFISEDTGNRLNLLSCAYSAENFLEQFSSDSRSYITFCNSYDEIVLICMYNGEIYDEHSEDNMFAEKLARHLGQICNADVFACIGCCVYEPALLSLSYNSARTVTACSMFIGFRSLSCQADVIQGHSSSVLSSEQCRNLRLFSLLGDFEGAVRYIKDEIFNTLSITKQQFPILFITIIFNLVNEINTYYIPMKNDILSMRKSFPPAECIQTTEACLNALQLSIEMMKQICNNNYTEKSSYVEKMKNIAQSRYSEALSLKMISDILNVSPSYLGSLFINETGETFSTYINRLRIEKAKLLLKNKTVKISDISRLTGFTTINYFYTIFKKITGLSPAEYREKLSE